MDYTKSSIYKEAKKNISVKYDCPEKDLKEYVDLCKGVLIVRIDAVKNGSVVDKKMIWLNS